MDLSAISVPAGFRGDGLPFRRDADRTGFRRLCLGADRRSLAPQSAGPEVGRYARIGCRRRGMRGAAVRAVKVAWWARNLSGQPLNGH